MASLSEIRARAVDEGSISAAAIAELTATVRLLQDSGAPSRPGLTAGASTQHRPFGLLQAPLAAASADAVHPSYTSSLRPSSGDLSLGGPHPASALHPPVSRASAPGPAATSAERSGSPDGAQGQLDFSHRDANEWELSANTQRNSVRFQCDEANSAGPRPMVGRGRDHTPAVLSASGSGAAAFMVPARNPYSYPVISESDRVRHQQSDASRGGGIRGSSSIGH